MSENQMPDIASLLEMELDDLPDLPEFFVPPSGTYAAKITLELKEIAKKTAIEATLELTEVGELANPTDTPPAAGTKCSQAFFLDNEFGVGGAKELIAAFKSMGVINFRTAVELVKGIEGVVTIKKQADKKDADKFYTRIQSFTPA